jgi:isopenicillin-N epimerase
MTWSSQPSPVRSNVIQGIEVAWESARELFSLDPAVGHLNHGSFGAVPTPVQRAQQRLRDEMEANPMAFFSRGITDRLAHTRRRVATFIGADPDDTALIPNATAGVQLALSALHPRPGDEILLTDHGYGAVRFAVDRLCANTGATVTQAAIPLRATDDEAVEILTAAVRPGRTRFAIVDQVTSPTARILPVARIATALKERGVMVVVDGAHAPGMLPVDVTAIGADIWFGNLYKWAFAPRPSAVLVATPEYRGRIEPLVVSWEKDNGFPAAVEYGGTLDYTAWLAAPTGLHLLRTLGLDRMRRHNADLAAYGQRTIAAALGIDRADLTGSDQASMRVVPLPPGAADDIQSATDLMARIAADLRFEVAVFAWRHHGLLRLSAQIYNRVEDYDQLAAVLPGLLRDLSAARGRPAV